MNNKVICSCSKNKLCDVLCPHKDEHTPLQEGKIMCIEKDYCSQVKRGVVCKEVGNEQDVND